MDCSAVSDALDHPAPSKLARVIASKGLPEIVGGVRWDYAFALRVSQMQWSGESWTMDHYEDWMALWNECLPGLDLSSRAGERPGVFHLLDDMKKAEERFLPGLMYLDRWEGLIRQMAAQGLDLSATSQGVSALEYLLRHTTKHPYSDLSGRWVAHHGAKFNQMTGSRVIMLMTRLIDPGIRKPGQPEISEAVSVVLQEAILACQDASLVSQIEQWSEGRETMAGMGPLVSAAQQRCLDISTANKSAPVRGLHRL